jgi:hypothetical protein
MARYIIAVLLLHLCLLHDRAAAAAAKSDREPAVASTRACGQEVKLLACAAGSALDVRSAFYGRADAAACAERGAELNHGAGATGAYCALDGALAAVRRACDGRRSCEVSYALMLAAADPCPGASKHLDVTYACADTGGGWQSALRARREPRGHGGRRLYRRE